MAGRRPLTTARGAHAYVARDGIFGGASKDGVTAIPPRRDRQHADDFVAAHHHHFVHHVDDDADVVGHDPHDIADIGPGVAAREVEKAVLLGKARDLRLGMFEDQAVAVEAAAGVRRQGLRAGIENAASGPARLTTVE